MTFELTALLTAALRTLQGENPSAGLSMHVDDLSFDVEGHTRAVAVHRARVLSLRAAQLIEGELLFPFAPDMAVTIASSAAAQREAHAAMGLGPPSEAFRHQATRLGEGGPYPPAACRQTLSAQAVWHFSR